jgi:prolyl oligopeptidase
MISLPIVVAAALSSLATAPKESPSLLHGPYHYPPTAQVSTTTDYHGTAIEDPFRWLENARDPAVQSWTDEQEALTRAFIGDLPQRPWLAQRFGELWRYDDESVPRRVLQGERLFYSTKQKDQEKWAFVTRARAGAEPRVLLDPNTWPAADQLAGAWPSRDGTHLAFGTAHGGDENPVVAVMVVETGEILPDRLRGWKQSVTSWLPDGSGFYYSCKPREGEVPAGEHEYWHQTWLHRLGTDPAQDVKVFGDDERKETWNSVYCTEDGRYEVFVRGLFNANDVWFRRAGTADPLTPLAEGLRAEHDVEFVGDTILITTDADAPRRLVYVTDAAHPGREHWRVWLPQHPRDNLLSVAAIAGRVYVTYLHDAYTLVQIFDLGGTYLRDLPLPTIGSAGVGGYWSHADVWVGFSSFTFPPTTYQYDFARDELVVYHEFPLRVDTSGVVADQVWFTSKDGTQVPMFLVHRRDAVRDGDRPTLLTGYGGFDVSQRPAFATSYLVWLEAGGVLAVANLRGGGEFGREWHEGAMREKKQNCFDDFLAAAEWLIANRWTRPARLAIRGGSNGGLLVGACLAQRPELFQAVVCQVPLLDMVNYHQFGLANIWAEEYGSSDDPDQFQYLLAYSPYHNLRAGVAYPAFLCTGSENDARVDPLHARKMVARLQSLDDAGGPHLLLVRRESGHGGGTTITTQIEQTVEVTAFLMERLGMSAPVNQP